MSSPETGTSQQRPYFPALDGLRAIAVLLVVGFHAAVPGDVVFRRGSYGVQLFFAVSGVLITTLLLRERRATGAIDLRGFYRRRTARIFPLYYLVLGLYCLLVWTTQRGVDADAFWRNLPSFLTYTTNWAVDHQANGARVIFLFAWSLAVEEQFYLVWPSALVWLKRWAPFVLVAAVWIQPYYFGAIALGCLVAMALDAPGTRPVVARLLRSPWPAAVAVLLVLMLQVPTWIGTLAAVWLVGSLVVADKHLVTRALSWRPLRWIGGVSYGIYMLHQLALNAARKGHVQGYALVLVAATAAVLVAAVSFYFVERPISQWARSGRQQMPGTHDTVKSDTTGTLQLPRPAA